MTEDMERIAAALEGISDALSMLALLQQAQHGRLSTSETKVLYDEVNEFSVRVTFRGPLTREPDEGGDAE